MIKPTYNFYLGKRYNKLQFLLTEGYYDPETLEFIPDQEYLSTLNLVKVESQYLWADKLFKYKSARILLYDENGSHIGNLILPTREREILWLAGAKYILITLKASEYAEAYTREALGTYKYIDFIYSIQPINPVYKTLTKRLSKESGQEFFRETLEGNFTLQGEDFLKVYSAPLDTKFAFLVYFVKNRAHEELYFCDYFTKVSCTFDYGKYTCKPKLLKQDRYTAILDKYDTVYDLYKLGVPTSEVGLLKRPAIQLYVRGSQKITTALDGVFWESEVSEVQSDSGVLNTKYHFVRNGTFSEFRQYNTLTIDDKTYKSYIAEFVGNFDSEGSSIPGRDLTRIAPSGAPEGKINCDCYLVKIASKGDWWNWDDLTDSSVYGTFFDIFTNQEETAYGITQGEYDYGKYRRDAYVLRIRSRGVSDTFPYWQSRKLFYIGDSGIKALGTQGDIEFWRKYENGQVEQSYVEVLGVNDVFARLLCDVDSITDAKGQTYNTHDIPFDDFVQDNRNHKKCYGIAVGNIYANPDFSDRPTRYGRDDWGRYFTRPYSKNSLNVIPLDQSQWINFSLWYVFSEVYPLIDQAASKKYYLRDAHPIADVIQVLLNEIAPGIRHEATPEYSQFLYGGDNAVRGEMLHLFMTQKTNILKGEYDQAAKKVEVSLEDIMNMLQKCFKCYFWVEDNKLRIEHISWFQNGGSYVSDIHKVGLDLTAKKDKFNKIYPGYFQSELSYDMQSLPARYSFGYMDDQTEVFSNVSFEVDANYVDAPKSEDVTVSTFATDIDYMLISPSSFSEEGFALIGAKYENDEYSCPVLEQELLTDEGYRYTVRVQNGYLGWPYLLKYYMYDLPSLNLLGHFVENLTPVSTIRFMEHTVKTALPENFNAQESILTTAGEGVIQQIDTDLNTQVATITLAYKPL